MPERDEIYVGGYQDRDQLNPADSLAGELGEDPLDAGYSPPDREPAGLRRRTTDAEQWQRESLDERLAEEEPETGDDEPGQDIDIDRRTPQQRTGRLVAPDEGGLDDDEPLEIARDVGRAGWAASAEEAAMHLVPDEDDEGPKAYH
jgi:hypothetical protein